MQNQRKISTLYRDIVICVFEGIFMKLDFEKTDGLIPAIAQDFATGEVLMLAYINEEAWNETLATGRAVYYSRSRKKLWRKGEESGNVQVIKDIRVDCDCDTVIFMVEQIGGAACHTAAVFTPVFPLTEQQKS